MARTPTVEQLTAAAQDAMAKAAAARDAADQARAEAEGRRQARRADIDRRWLAEYDPQALHRAVTATRLQLVAAVRADPVWAAVIDLLAAKYRHYQWHHEAAAVRDRLGLEPVADLGPHPVRVIGFDELALIADQTAAGTVADEMDALDARREAAGDTTP